ncbi:hypothetical protein HHO41_10910 [Bacillus sp. DNRA2]|uniref:hypothetical protein n=1 Tax=Bacillus sp. DNRA2 TaxID=2723053 RepID=UPI00145DB06F|nr:hypothetical protein [Bacillus sp. DNRA2]NMD70802.1 hypothetical protein [Bacillus sp. DNRA2]
MDKIVIVGGYEFLSFHLCRQFLEQGYLVECINFENNTDLFYEEKQFSVGRNSNLVEHTLREWMEIGIACEQDSLIIITIFDLFLKKNAEMLIAQLEGVANELPKTERFNPAKVVFLQPLYQQIDNPNSLGAIHEKLVKCVTDKGIPHCTISLPTLYGPWQPVEFSFQQAIYNDLKNCDEFALNPKEWCYDAIYIDDAVTELFRLINDEKLETCTFKNRIEDEWMNCANYLGINSIPCSLTLVKDGTRANDVYKEICGTVDCQQGLLIQKEHLIRFLAGM